MGRRGTVDIVAAGWDPREATQRELLALARMEDPEAHGSPGAFRRAAGAQLPNATVCLDKFHVVAPAKDASGDARRRAGRRPGKPTADAKRAWKPLVADRARLCRAPRAHHWQGQEEPGARAAERRNKALAKIADALAGSDESHREIRRAYLMLQLFYERAAADFAGDRECREALSGWTGQAEGCGVKEIAAAARSIKDVKALVAGAWTTGRTNAYAENANRKIKDVKRRSCGSAKCENVRRRLLLAVGRPPLGKGGVPLPNYNE